MKKLMTMLAAAATAFGLYAADTGFISGAGFDTSDTANPTPGAYTWLYDAQTTTGDFVPGYWTGTTAAKAIWTAGASRASDNTDRPAQYVDEDLQRQYNGYLTIATTGNELVGQYILPSGDPQTIDAAKGLYFDGLVQFTAFDETPVIDANAKIAVFPMLNDPDDESKGASLWVKSSGGTNLWKTAKTIDGEWHRVTIKMINNILKSGSQVGFVVYVDGEAVECAAAQAAFADPTALTAEANSYYVNKQLFGALTGDAQMTEVAFGGKGAIDEIAFTENAPDFAASPTFYKVAWDTTTVESVTGLTSNPQDIEVSGAPVTYTYTAQDGYISGTTNITGGAGQTYTITAAKLGASVLKWNGEEWVAVQGGQVSTFADALALVDNSGKFKIALAQNEGAIEINKADCDLTIDLAGNTIEVATGNAITLTAGALTIEDSSDPQTGTVKGAVFAMPVNTSITINAGIYDGVVSIPGTATINGGKFEAVANEQTIATLQLKVPTGSSLVLENGYYVVKATFNVTFANGTNSTISPDAGTSNYVAGTKLTITATAAADCRFGEVSAPWDKVSDTVAQIAEYEVTAADTITAPDAVAINYVAQINDNKYESLQAAIDALDGNQTIVLINNHTTPDTGVTFNKSCTFDLNGKELTVATTAITGKKFAIEGATVTLTNGTIQWSGSDGYGIQVKNGAVVNVYCTITTTDKNKCPVFDSYYGTTINVYDGANLSSGQDVIRIKSDKGEVAGDSEAIPTETVNIYGGYLKNYEDTSDRGIINHYKENNLVLNITGGQFDDIARVIGFSNSKKNPTITCELDDTCTAQFKKVDDSKERLIGCIKDGYALVADGSGWYVVGKATYNVTLTGTTDGSAAPATYQISDVAQTVVLAAGTAPTDKVFDQWVLTEKAGVSIDGDTITIAAGTIGDIAVEATWKSAAPEIPEVAPGGSPVEVKAEDAEKVVIKATAPAGSGITDEAYTAYFKKLVTPVGESGMVNVSAVLDEEAIEFTESVEDLGEEVGKIAAGAEEVTIAAKPGLYYYVEEADDVTKIAEPERNRVMATGATVTVPTTKFEGSGFYRLNCSTTQRGIVTGGQE